MSGAASSWGSAPFLRSWPARVGLLIGSLVLCVALLGPLIAPYGPSELVGQPFDAPTGDHLLGLDTLGRDVLSRVFYGGRSVITMALATTALAYVVGLSLGLAAGYSRGRRTETVILGLSDTLLAFPALLVVLILTTGLGTGFYPIIIGVAITNVPGIVRVVRAATLEVVGKGYVEAAIARGEGTISVLRHEILPNIASAIVTDAGPRLTVAILVIAGLNFLGLGLQPPAADWGLMINENRQGLGLQAWSIAAPALLIAALTISINVVADAFVRSRGHSVADEFQRR